MAGGLLIAIRNSVPFTLHHCASVETYLLLHCSLYNEDYVLVNIHNTLFHCKGYKQRFLDWLHQVWSTVQQFPSHRVLLGGDFNARLDPDHCS